MIIPYADFGKEDFSLSDLKILRQTPIYRELDCPSRKVNGFLYILSGICHYSFSGGEFELCPGAVVYLPLGSKHRLELLSDRTEFYRIDFVLEIGGDTALFSDVPKKITDSAPYECREAADALFEEFLGNNSSLVKTEKLCRFISFSQIGRKSKSYGKLAPAVERLQSLSDDKINCKELADRCFLSVSQFYKLFGETFGMSPLEYQSAIVVRRAVAMLESQDMTVGEVASELGFENASYFARFFKKHTGKSPSEIAKNNK